jgi:transcriptional regulator with XRE-family HTH domain
VEEPIPVRNARSDYPEIGDRLRTRRQEKGLSLRDLASRLGVSPSLISQIERGRANPSVSTLYALVSELDVSLDELLFDRRAADRPTDGPTPADPSAGRPGSPLQLAATRSRIKLASGVIWERLTTVSEPGVEFLHVTYQVGGASSPEDAYQRHTGHEWGYVLSGTLEVRIGFERYVLQPGDAISIDSALPHRLATLGDEPVEAIWFVLGRASLDRPQLFDGERSQRPASEK